MKLGLVDIVERKNMKIGNMVLGEQLVVWLVLLAEMP